MAAAQPYETELLAIMQEDSMKAGFERAAGGATVQVTLAEALEKLP